MSVLSYVKTIWKSGRGGGTPISPENLNNIENGIEQVTNKINELMSIKTLPSGTDLDTVVEDGNYIGTSLINVPYIYALIIRVMRVTIGNSTIIFQEAKQTDGGKIYLRRQLNGNWETWCTYSESKEWVPIIKNSLSSYADEIVIPSEAKEIVVQVYSQQINQAYMWYFPQKTILPKTGNRYLPKGYSVSTGAVSITLNANQTRVRIENFYYSNGTLSPQKTSLCLLYK